jgi:mRNA interferase MazF
MVWMMRKPCAYPSGRGEVNQGDIYWVDLGEPRGSAPGHRRPCVIVQNDRLNRTRIGTTIVCPLTGNVRWSRARGNVLLDPGEGGLPQRSVVNVSQILTIDRSQLEEYVGSLSGERVCEIVDGISLVVEASDASARSR